MGCIFSKPLTLDDVNTALKTALTPISNGIAQKITLNDVNTALKTALTPISNDITLLKDSLLAPDGDKIAKDITVAVYSVGATSVTCHGCLMRRDNNVYLVSAAHAIVDLTFEGEYSIKWSVHKPWDLYGQVTFDRVHIPEDYVLQGSKDIGIARVNVRNTPAAQPQPQPDLPPPNDAQWLPVSVSVGELVGKTVVGHGRVFLRGAVLAYPDENRIMINTPSISGCSGCPLVDGSEKLAAFVHGGVKHRGGRVLHKQSSATYNVTGYVYADSVAGVTLALVQSSSYPMLQLVEFIADPLAAEPTDQSAYNQHASGELKQAAPHAATLEEAMIALRDKIWPAAARVNIAMGQQVELLSHRTPATG